MLRVEMSSSIAFLNVFKFNGNRLFGGQSHDDGGNHEHHVARADPGSSGNGNEGVETSLANQQRNTLGRVWDLAFALPCADRLRGGVPVFKQARPKGD